MQDKKTLITIIILLLIFAPLSVLGTIKSLSFKNDKIIDDNPNKEFIYNNKVYFYQNDKLISSYECKNECQKVEATIDDTNYHTNSYTLEEKSIEPIINDMFGIFKEGNSINLYNLVGNIIAEKYQAVKSYNVDSINTAFIAMKNKVWGVSYLDMSAAGIPYEYDYIALPAHFIDGKLDTKKFIAAKNGLWYIINADGTIDNPAVRDEIVDFNDNYYITYDGTYHIKDYKNVEYLNDLTKDRVYALDKYLFVVSNNILLIYENATANVIQSVNLENYETMYFSKVKSGVEIYLDKNKFQTIELN